MRVRGLIRTGEIATTQPVAMELFVGARDEEHERMLRRMVAGFHLLPFDAETDFDVAARIYRLCRVAGVTPRGLIDCMIAAVAMRHRVAVLSHDADFARIADVVALELDEHSRR